MDASLLSRLPLELHNAIINHLRFPDTAHLRATCRHFASLIPVQNSHFLHLLRAEDSAWAVKRRRVTCVYCARMRPASAFTERQKAINPYGRSCIDCQKIDFGSGPEVWTGHVPHKLHRTRITNRETKIKVDWKEKGVCSQCHNSFDRWGKQTAARAVCIRCYFEDNSFDVNHVESARLHRDLDRKGLRGQDLDRFNGDDLCQMRYRFHIPTYSWYGWDHPPATIPIWRGGDRGVNVRTREEAQNLYFEVELERTASGAIGWESARRALENELPRGKTLTPWMMS